MSPQSRNEKVHRSPSAFLHRKGRHNLLFYLCLLVIAGIFILAAPAQAAGGAGSIQQDQFCRFVPGELVYQEDFCLAEYHVVRTGHIGDREIPGAFL